MRSKQLLSNDVSPDKDDWHRRRLAQGCLYSTASIMLSVYASSFGRRVVPATISVESERIAPGHIIQRSPFVRFEISDLGESQLQSVMEKLSGFGTEYHFIANEATLVCSKLCLLAPLALTTTLPDGRLAKFLRTRSGNHAFALTYYSRQLLFSDRARVVGRTRPETIFSSGRH